MTNETESPDAEVIPPGNQPKSFLAFLGEQQNGVVVHELSKELRDLTEAIEDNFDRYRGKISGELSIKFKITLEGGIYRVDTEYRTKRPNAPPAGTVMWLGGDGNLATQNPRQLTMSFATRPQSVG